MVWLFSDPYQGVLPVVHSQQQSMASASEVCSVLHCGVKTAGQTTPAYTLGLSNIYNTSPDHVTTV